MLAVQLKIGRSICYVSAVASIPIRGGRSLCPVKNRGESFDKVVDQNFPPIFTGQTTPLTKLSP